MVVAVSIGYAVRHSSGGRYAEDVASWDVRGVSADGRTLTVVYEIGDSKCYSLDRLTKAESPTTVEINIVHRRRLDVACDDFALEKATYVRLESPLGRRRLVNGGTGQPAEIYRSR